VIVAYIDEHRDGLGVEPICRVLTDAGTQIAPSTYYAVKTRAPSARSVSDAATTTLIKRVHKDNYSVYGARKVHAELRRQGHPVARCTVQRLMRQAGLRGISRAKGPRTTSRAADRTCGRTWSTAASGPRRPIGSGRGHHLLPHLRRLGLRRVRHRRLQPPRGGLTAVDKPAHRPGPGALEMGLWTRQHEAATHRA
jgi:hypothetical protein